jgi:calcineurin-like phosphoesterase family protein
MPDPHKIIITVRRAAELFRATPGRQGSVVALDTADEVLVVGDLHGNVPVFRRILNIVALAQNPGRHLVLQELAHGSRLYPDGGGDKSHQLIDLVSALKCQYPERVHLILGNHELSEVTNRPIAKDGVYLNDLFRRGIETAYGAMATEVMKAYHDLFLALPLAARTPNRVFLCHTIPDYYDLDRLDVEILKTIAWPPESLLRGGTVYAMTWGRDTTPETLDRFAAMVDADWFITGHQPCDEGFRRANHRQIIIDGTDPYPAYCLFPTHEPVTIERLLECVKVVPLYA